MALAFSTVVMVSTPFLIPEVRGHYDVGLSVASLVGVFQLGGFAVGSWGSGRRLVPSRSVLVASLVLAAASNAVSAWLPPLSILLTSRFASGLSLGVIAWFAWSNAFGREQAMNRVAVVGPVIGVISTPVVAVAIDRQGMPTLFVALALLPLIPLLFTAGVPTGEKRDRRARRPAVPAARVMLGALTAFSLGGSAVFQFGVTIGFEELGLTASATAIAYTANALVSIPAAGWRWRRGIPGPWMALTATCAFFVATAFNTPIFLGAIIVWGFCYWMALPGVFSVLAEASAFPEERAGDAQAMMAIGRVGGPFLGGLLLDGPGTVALGLTGAGLMAGAAAAVFTVRGFTERRDR